MIECANCETAQFLQITQSRVYFEDGEMVNELSERYECTLCGALGRVESEEQTTVIDGEIRDTQDVEVWP